MHDDILGRDVGGDGTNVLERTRSGTPSLMIVGLAHVEDAIRVRRLIVERLSFRS